MTERGELRLIPATAEDAEDLTVLQAVTFFDDRKRMPSEHIAPESPVEGPDGCRSVEWNRRVIENPRTRYYKAEVGGRLIGGLILLDVGDGVWELGRIFVDPDVQDRGYGKQIIRAMYRSHPDVECWRLGTPEWASRNRHFYEQMGFTEAELIPPGDNVPWSSIGYENRLPQEERVRR